MTYQSLQEIENKYAESENDSPVKRIENRKNKNQAIKRFNERQQKSFQLANASSSTPSNQAKRKSKEVLTEQEINIQHQNTITENELPVNKKRKIITSKNQIIAANNSIF